MARFALILLILTPLLAQGENDPPPDKVATATMQGAVQAQGQPVPPEIVVYLEPVDATQRFPVPESHVRISQKGAQFSPAFTVVSVGQSVEFLNDEDRAIEHNVFSNAANAKFDLGLFPPGQSRPVTFNEPGPVVLYCSIHKFMDGAIFVCPNPLFSRVDTDGHYTITGVPPGQYTLKTWQRRRRFPELSLPVTIDAGQTAISKDLELRRK